MHGSQKNVRDFSATLFSVYKMEVNLRLYPPYLSINTVHCMPLQNKYSVRYGCPLSFVRGWSGAGARGRGGGEDNALLTHAAQINT